MLPDQIQLAPNGPSLSRIVAGTMTWGEWGAKLSTNEMAELIGTCLDNGITTFDHADIYGHYSTESDFGEALAALGSSVRGSLQLVSKCGIRLVTARRPENRVKSYDTSKEYIIKSAERSLSNLRTDYLDVFLIHRPDTLMDPVEVAEAFQELKDSGKVLHFGVSNFTPSQFELLNDHFPLVTNQVECNPLHSDLLFDGTFDQLLRRQLKPMIWSPLGGKRYFNGESTIVLRLRDAVRMIAKKHDTTENVILLAWLLKHPSGMLPVVGTTKAERLVEARAALGVDLDRQDWFVILEAARGAEVA
ncbi:aldo/keto reductase [Neolewinella antarctica]|uniref:Oxidoreductase n=1 Tax=Neolewinella antarctica TaxID=442734 RepID=A0ABX0XDN1_9BACT|nr:aldo/keto reductase [Neolewinella antarctica]NJC26867.1 putative oxidoreductase [Neolewinella antarctica]